MGNSSNSSNKNFKGPGRILGTGEVVNNPPPRRSSFLKAVTGGEPARTSVKKPPPKSSPPKPLTEEQKRLAEERRKATAEAAAARDRAWEERLAKQRARRLASEGQAEETKPLAWNETKTVTHMPANPEVMRKQQEARESIEKSGFNPYQATMATSSNARATINSINEDGSAPPGRAGATPLPPASSSVDAEEKKMRQARLQLLQAMQGNDTVALAVAISEAEKYDVPDVREAKELYMVLGGGDESAEEGDFSSVLDSITAFKSASESPQKKQEASKTMQILLRNLLAHPEEAKFRKIRLENENIRNKIVLPAQGTCIAVLESVGFNRVVDEASNEQIMIVPDPATLPPELVAYAKKACEIALDSLSRM